MTFTQWRAALFAERAWAPERAVGIDIILDSIAGKVDLEAAFAAVLADSGSPHD